MSAESTLGVARDRTPDGQLGPTARGLRVCTPQTNSLDPETQLGGEMYEIEILREMGARGIVFDIIIAGHRRCAEVPNSVVHRLRLSYVQRYWQVAPLRYAPAIRWLYTRTRFDVLRVNSLRYIGPAALMARSWLGVDVPIVAHHHHLDRHWLNPVIEGWVMGAAERVIVGSEFARRQAVEELGVPAEKFTVVPYGVDRAFTPGPKPEALGRRLGVQDAPVVLFLGSLQSRKNPRFLLDVWREVIRTRPDARLIVAGAGPLLNELRVQARTLDNTVVFTGHVPAAEKLDYYRLADLLVFPSLMEGFGFVVAEAMSCGLPVVVSNRGSLPELVVPAAGGVVADPTDRDGFVRGILALLGDPTVRRRFGSANRERVERLYRWDVCAAATARVYEEVVQAWRAQRRPR